MRIKPDFEIIEIADEFLAVPVGKEAESFHGVVALSEEAAFLLKNMNETKTETELVDLLLNNYELDQATAEADVRGFLANLLEMGLAEED